MAAQTLKIVLAYDGGGFVGWQRQINGPSIQGLIEDALAQIEGAAVAVAGAGRTDAGVHALGQVASAVVTCEMDPLAIRRALNSSLPPSVRAVSVETAPPQFNARFDATSKTYRYVVVNTENISPFDVAYAWHVRQPIDIDAVAAAARLLEGAHDFAAFQATGTMLSSTVRRVMRSEVRSGRSDPGRGYSYDPAARTVVYEVTGSGFLRHMVRIIVGTLVEIGHGRRPPAAIPEILAGRDRRLAGPTAPARGLYLVQVDFDRTDERETWRTTRRREKEPRRSPPCSSTVTGCIIEV